METARDNGNWQEALRLALQAQQLRDEPSIRAIISWTRGDIAWDGGDHHLALTFYEKASKTIPTFTPYADQLKKYEEQVAAEDQAARDARDQAAAGQQAANEISSFRAGLDQKVATIQSEENAAIASADDRVRAYVNPAMFVTQAQYESASGELLRLQRQRDNLTAKIAELQKWSAGLGMDEKEFETIRVGAQEDLGWEFIDHVPVAEALDGLNGNPALKGLNVEKIKAAYEAAKGLLQTGQGISTRDDQEREQKIIDGNREFRNAMIHTAALSEENRALLDAVSKIISFGAKSAIAEAHADSMSDRDKLKTVMTLVEALQPLWGLGVLGENLAERGVQNHEATLALDSLHEAQSSNWNAQRYLTDKLNRVNDEAKEEQVIIDKYHLANRESR